ncbi:class I SAM-dependent methyltransferase [Mangrovicoccus sp. HB161399]|uniref:class I SAM-dependent methyltransferase n=1 Tax=Mangrovicoccus sp. HB161399 TaxID=2720392 RepID=UPI0015563395|nr:class I SAM-dependent methyltransferase [Mangrovicoccus sp. HB161399]
MTHANDAQEAFWNKGPGQRWVEYQPDLDLLHAEVTSLLLTEAQAWPGMKVLDIGCGAGASAFAAAQAVGPEGQVTGADISAVLLDRARQRAAAEGTENVRFVLADAQDADLGGPYDLAISRFGVMFFADPAAAFANIRRHLAPGAHFVFAAWSAPGRNPWFQVPRAAAAARLGAPAPADPDAPGPTAFRDIGRVSGLLAEAGFADPEGHAVEAVLPHPGGIEAVLAMMPYIGPVGSMMREKEGTEEDLDAILGSIAVAFSQWDGPGGLVIPAEVNLFSARAD